MTNIEKLISELCPNGVPFKTLGEVCTCTKGQQLNKNVLLDEGYPVINGGINPSGFWREYNYPANTITISQGGASAGYVNYIETPFWAGAHCYILTEPSSDINYRFLYYNVKQAEGRLMQCQYGAGIPALAAKVVNSLSIPVPPLEIQERIVEILDAYSQLAAELQAELQKRRTQYEYYRTRLLTPPMESNSADSSTDGCNWEWKTLGEIGTFQRGNGLQKKDFTETGVGCIHYGQIYTKLGTFCKEPITRVPETLAARLVKVYPGNLVIACTSENVEDCCKSVVWMGEETIVTGGHAAVFRHTQNPKYIAYFFQTDIFHQQKRKFTKGVKVIDIKIDEIAQIQIPIPPLAEQERIVAILDKFEALTTSLTDGIPAEQAAQQKKYEYYRDLLLNFDRL